MKKLFDLIEYLDDNHHYAQSDEMIKLALDMSDVINDDSFQDKGAYGKFYSDFSKDEKNKIKNKLGPVHDDIGFKKFIHPDTDFNTNLKEILSFIYIAPYISANTDLKTPIYKGEISLSGIISNNIIPTQRMPGITLAMALEIMYASMPRYTANRLDELTFEAIETKLHKIGVYWDDITSYNIIVDPKVVKECIEAYQKGNLNQTYNLSKGASLFDFGHFRVKADTQAGKNLQKLKAQLNRVHNNTLVNALTYAIDIILS